MKIAVCEDEVIIAEKLADTVRGFLKNAEVKCSIDVFFDASSFLDGAELYDLIFIDCQLPDMNGIELAKR